MHFSCRLGFPRFIFRGNPARISTAVERAPQAKLDSTESRGNRNSGASSVDAKNLKVVYVAGKFKRMKLVNCSFHPANGSSTTTQASSHVVVPYFGFL